MDRLFPLKSKQTVEIKMPKTRRASRKSSRKASRKDRKSTRKQAGGKRSEWMNKVMRAFKEGKAKNPKFSLKDAMIAAKKM